ncbi:MAG: hypothetical protein AB7T37_17325 [Dehalococcoidia bacterium]
MNMKMLAVGLIGGAATMVAVVPAALAATSTDTTTTSGTTTTAVSGQQAPRLRMAPQGTGSVPAGHGRMAMRGGPGGHLNIIEAAAAELGMTPEELKTELEAGKSILDVAAENGVDAATLTANVTAAAKADVATKLAAGEITQEQADHALAEIDEHIADVLSGARPEGGRGMKGDCDRDGDGAPDGTNDDEAASTEA